MLVLGILIGFAISTLIIGVVLIIDEMRMADELRKIKGESNENKRS